MTMTETAITNTVAQRRGEEGMTLIAVMAIMAVFAIALLAVAPSVTQEIQREKELETIRRGEEVAEAIRQYVEFYKGAKLPQSMDDLLEGLPQGTKKRMILRESAAVDPLSPDGKWRLIKPDPQTLARFARRVQNFNNGLLPSSTGPLQRYAVVIVNTINTDADDDSEADEDFEVVTSNQPFIGVASQDRGPSVIAYYGIENHSKWIFTPLFRGSGAFGFGQRPQQQQQQNRQKIDSVQP
jgi:type II secretory pathway pseudopilin PulG